MIARKVNIKQEKKGKKNICNPEKGKDNIVLVAPLKCVRVICQKSTCYEGNAFKSINVMYYIMHQYCDLCLVFSYTMMEGLDVLLLLWWPKRPLLLRHLTTALRRQGQVLAFGGLFSTEKLSSVPSNHLVNEYGIFYVGALFGS